MSEQRNYHTVKKGDTLWQIAKDNGTTAEALKKINGIQSAHKINIGQRIALRKEAVCGVEALFLDRDRNPIKGLHFRMEQCGKTRDGTTGENGKSKQLFTETPDDTVKIWIKRLDGGWKLVTTVVSGFGNKLVTLVSAHMVVEARTEKHPDLPPGAMPDPREKPKPTHGPGKAPPPTTDKKALGLKATSTKTSDGKALTVVEGDIPDLSFLDEYNGEVMTEADYEWAAKELDIEKAAIKAFAIVETGESKNPGFVKIGQKLIPAILYERHKFAAKTNNKYSAKYPDISLPVAYYNAKAKYVPADATYKKVHGVSEDIQYYRPIRDKDSKETKESAVKLKDMLEAGKATVERDKYASGEGSYKRLSKAYQLDQDAALGSCSWGTFQIMGEYWKTMKYGSVKDFVKSVSRSPREQLKAFVLYIKYVNPSIKKYLKKHDWVAVAEAYNGKSYKDNNYDVKLEAAYKKFKDEE